MMARRLTFALISSVALMCCIYLAPPCFAQDNVNADASLQPADCPALNPFPQLVATVVVSCEKGASIELKMPLKPDAQGFAREKSVQGAYDFREYRIPRVDQQEHAFDSIMQLIPMAGYVVKYSSSPSIITARKEDTWILIRVNGASYNVSVVRNTPIPCTPVKNAEEISREIEAHNRVPIYGIQFAAPNQAMQETGSEILKEVLKYLRQNPNLTVFIESHKVSTTGTPEDDLGITKQRANAIVDWLVAHGVPAARLQARPFGRTKSLTENDTPQEIQCNERIELSRAPK
jgi:outer membrane protein OmpA-like peptidoglycan-associated protein